MRTDPNYKTLKLYQVLGNKKVLISSEVLNRIYIGKRVRSLNVMCVTYRKEVVHFSGFPLATGDLRAQTNTVDHGCHGDRW
jgi:hypothetical protein